MPFTVAAVQSVVPPVGLVEVTTSPTKPTATHRLLLGQETPMTDSPLVPASNAVHADGPAVGLIDVISSPLISAATQRVALKQEMP